MSETVDTHLLLRAFCDELGRCGIAGAVTSPGSRNTPVLLALVRDGGFPAWSHVDERTAGFFALGMGRATGRPGVLTCTSGTAAAHYHPAVIEAHESRVPLVVITADRPPELRASGAGQTIDQIKLFGDAVRWFCEVGAGHRATPERLRWVRTLACRAVDLATGPTPGPVHLNWALREPLVLDEPLPPDPLPGRPGGGPWVRRENQVTVPSVAAEAERPVLVLGRDERGLGDLARSAGAAGWPVLADPLSGGRTGPGAIAHYDAFLRDGAAPEPDLVVRAGDLPTSKPLRTWLAGLACEQWHVDPHRTWHDPAYVVARRVEAVVPAPAQDGWLERWRALDRPPDLGEGLTEHAIARALADVDGIVFTAASLPVRDLELTWPALDRPPRVLAHRGANGIDGTMAAAFGVAAATGEHVVCHLGDVAFAHDVGALQTLARHDLPVTVLCVDNGGGRIFDRLPIATQADAYEEHVLTPTGLDPGRIAEAFGVRVARPVTVDELRDELRAPGFVHVRSG
jgi:2-succinyl-5-enolpyruvyl-6-hydroxy-3-cyclohexene-1-carboxylate synthase